MVIDTALGSNSLKLKRYECGTYAYDKWLKEFAKCRTLEMALDLAKDLAVDEDYIQFIISNDGEVLLKFVIEESEDKNIGDSLANIWFYADGVRFLIK